MSLAGIGLIGTGLGSFVFLALWLWERGGRKGAEKDLALMAKDRDRMKVQAEHMQGQFRSEQEKGARLEEVNAGKNAAIAALEADLEACSDPSVVRAQLRRLLAGPDSLPAVD